ncbi:hypothetical protein DAI22_07g140100 [Oryza sativa Japonica Group]|nr:hypothetical protein DAI22_07g140100 [Oryza sativa Japonica Group]
MCMLSRLAWEAPRHAKVMALWLSRVGMGMVRTDPPASLAGPKILAPKGNKFD